MRLRGLGILACAVLLSAVAFAQTQDFYSGYLDVAIAKVKPEKRAEFDAINKKMAEANRRNKGDNWIVSETIEGEWNTVYYTSARQSYAEIEKGMDAFMGALGKPGGAAASAKMMQDFYNCVQSFRVEVRRRRGDLSSNPPADAAALAKMVGETRWVRTVMVRVRPGRLGEMEGQLKAIKAAREQATPKVTTLVSQSSAGQQGAVLYITTLGSSLGALDPSAATPLPKLLGEEGFQKYLKVISETVLTTENVIHRYLPELSNPPEEIAAIAPDFWKPKAAVTMKAKPKAPEAASKTQ